MRKFTQDGVRFVQQDDRTYAWTRGSAEGIVKRLGTLAVEGMFRAEFNGVAGYDKVPGRAVKKALDRAEDTR